MLKLSRLSAFIAAARLKFGPSISLYSSSASSIVAVGQPATFWLIASGTPPFSYQWKKDGVDIPGATNSTLTIASAQSSDVAEYQGVATNAAGSATSPRMTLTIQDPVTITTHPSSQTVNAGQSISLIVNVSGTAPFYYQWKKNGVNISGATNSSLSYSSSTSADAGSYTVQVSNTVSSVLSNAATVQVVVPVAPTITSGPTSFNNVPAGSYIYFSITASGTAPLSYQWKKNGVNITGATSDTYPISSVQSSDAGSYSVTVTNSVGSVTSNTATLTVSTPVSITSQPTAQTVNAGQQATFSVTATGSATITYQWRKNGTNISGATSSTLTISSAQVANAGSYDVVVSNPAGSVTSNSVMLSINGVSPTFSGWTTLNTGLPSQHTILSPTSSTYTSDIFFPLIGSSTILKANSNFVFSYSNSGVNPNFSNGSPTITRNTKLVTSFGGAYIVGSFQAIVSSGNKATVLLESPYLFTNNAINTNFGTYYPNTLGQSLEYTA